MAHASSHSCWCASSLSPPAPCLLLRPTIAIATWPAAWWAPFSREEGTAASKRIGIPSALEGRQILQKVRLHCITAIQQHFTSLKPPA